MRGIEQRYADVQSQTRQMSLHDLLAQASRIMTRRENVRALSQTGARGHRRRKVMARAVNRMHADDLDAAWRAALRGEYEAAVALVAESVSVERVDAHKGTPWRKSGWLNRWG